jgi:Ran GTPase-activating protein (RanGAP) involved in mRNA processing and transport
MFEPTLPSNIQILTLDYNNFGNEGLCNLMNYVKNSPKLNYLSMAYCGIDEKGIKFLENYLISTECPLETLVLQGNQLKNAGLNDLITLLLNNTSLLEINLNNVLFGNDPEGVIAQFANLMAVNQKIEAYHIKFNFIDNKGRGV